MDQHVEADGPELAAVQADERGDVLDAEAPGRVACDEIKDDKVLRAVGEDNCGRGVDEEEGADVAGDAPDPAIGNVKQRAVRAGEDLDVAVGPDLLSLSVVHKRLNQSREVTRIDETAAGSSGRVSTRLGSGSSVSRSSAKSAPPLPGMAYMRCPAWHIARTW